MELIYFVFSSLFELQFFEITMRAIIKSYSVYLEKFDNSKAWNQAISLTELLFLTHVSGLID